MWKPQLDVRNFLKCFGLTSFLRLITKLINARVRKWSVDIGNCYTFENFGQLEKSQLLKQTLRLGSPISPTHCSNNTILYNENGLKNDLKVPDQALAQ